MGTPNLITGRQLSKTRIEVLRAATNEGKDLGLPHSSNQRVEARDSLNNLSVRFARSVDFETNTITLLIASEKPEAYYYIKDPHCGG